MKTMAFKMASSKQYTKNNMPADLIALREKEKKKSYVYEIYIYRKDVAVPSGQNIHNIFQIYIDRYRIDRQYSV